MKKHKPSINDLKTILKELGFKFHQPISAFPSYKKQEVQIIFEEKIAYKERVCKSISEYDAYIEEKLTGKKISINVKDFGFYNTMNIEKTILFLKENYKDYFRKKKIENILK